MRLSLLAFLVLPLIASASTDEQIPLQPDMSEVSTDPYTPLTHQQPTLADLLTIEPSASIFYSYARELQLSETFADVSAKATLLVPTNKAVMALARKPHQGPEPPEDTGVVITEEELDKQSKANVMRWVSAHIIPEHPIALKPGTHATLLDGKPVTLTSASGKDDQPEWARVVLNGGIHIVAAKEAANGVMYMLDDTIKLD